jgi:hypothetical protein
MVFLVRQGRRGDMLRDFGGHGRADAPARTKQGKKNCRESARHPTSTKPMYRYDHIYANPAELSDRRCRIEDLLKGSRPDVFSYPKRKTSES